MWKNRLIISVYGWCRPGDVGCRIWAHQTGWKVVIDIPSISGPTNCWLFTFLAFLLRPWTLLLFLQLWSDNEKHCQWTFYMHRLIWIRKKVRKTFQFLQPLPTFWLASIHFSMNRFNWQLKIWKRNIVTWTCRRLAASLLTLSVVTEVVVNILFYLLFNHCNDATWSVFSFVHMKKSNSIIFKYVDVCYIVTLERTQTKQIPYNSND